MNVRGGAGVLADMLRSHREPFLADALVVRRVLHLHGLRPAEIEDAMQEIELRALQRPPRGGHRAWACTVATNLPMDVHRRGARRAAATAPAVDAQSADDAADALLREAVRTSLSALPPELRATVVLR